MLCCVLHYVTFGCVGVAKVDILYRPLLLNMYRSLPLLSQETYLYNFLLFAASSVWWTLKSHISPFHWM